jgi:hypothetical protein
VNNSELSKFAAELVAPKTRWLAIIAGCVSALAGSLPFGPLFSVVPAILIFGAVSQRWSPRPGRWLMWLGAFYLTAYISAYVLLGVHSANRLLAPYYDKSVLIVLLLSLVCLALVGWCDVALILDSLRSKNAAALADQEFPRSADWIVGLVTICLTAWAGWSILASFYPASRFGHWEILLVFVFSVAAFDAAIVVHAIKMYRSRKPGAH